MATHENRTDDYRKHSVPRSGRTRPRVECVFRSTRLRLVFVSKQIPTVAHVPCPGLTLPRPNATSISFSNEHRRARRSSPLQSSIYVPTRCVRLRRERWLAQRKSGETNAVPGPALSPRYAGGSRYSSTTTCCLDAATGSDSITRSMCACRWSGVAGCTARTMRPTS